MGVPNPGLPHAYARPAVVAKAMHPQTTLRCINRSLCSVPPAFILVQVFGSHAQFKDWFSNPLTGMVEGSAEVRHVLWGCSAKCTWILLDTWQGVHSPVCLTCHAVHASGLCLLVQHAH